MYVMLKDFAERRGPTLTADAIGAELLTRFQAEVQDADVSVFGAPPVDGLGTVSGFKLVLQDRGNFGLPRLQSAADLVVDEGTKLPELQRLFSNLRADTPWLELNIDRDKVRSLGISIQDLFQTLQVYLGSYYANNFNEFGRSWQVNIQADATFRQRIEETLQSVKVRNSQMEMVPLSTLIQVRPTSGPVMIMRYNLYPAAAIFGDVAPGTSSGRGLTLMEDLFDRLQQHGDIPNLITQEWTEMAYMQIQSGNTAMYLFALGVVLVFLVLAALYESWSLPLAVILVVPMCLLSSILGVTFARMDVNIFTQIGFVVLVGLASKNAILIVEFAKQLTESGQGLRQATIDACRLRLRPIMMTSFAFILGVVPLVIAQGAGAEMRRTLGTAVFSGMLGVTFFGIMLTPVFFYTIMSLVGRKPSPPSGPAPVVPPHGH
jgi:multidrug efflux pump subunit AcrB